MESNIINIATLTIDRSEANDSIVKTKQQIFELQKANSDLRKDISKNGDATGEQTKQFVANEAELKKLTAQYRTQQAAINDVTLAEIKNSKALTDSVKSVDQANAQNKELVKTRNQLDATTEQGALAIELLNKKMNENNKFLLANKNEQEKAATITGNYRQANFDLNGTLTSQGGIFNNVKSSVIGFKQNVSGAVDTVKSINNSVVGAAQNIIGFGNASKIAATQATTLAAGEVVATAATEGLAVAEGTATVASTGLASVLGVLLFPITAIIAAGLILYSVFKDFTPVINPIKDAIAALGAVFTVLKTAVLDLVTGTRGLGEIFSSLGSDMKDATVETYKLEGAQRALTKAMDIQELSSARTATRVKELILQSKDLSKSVKERTALINKAQSLEENEFNNRFKNYKKEKDILIDRIAVGKNLSDQDKARLTAGDYEFLKSIAKKKKLDSDLVESFKKNQLSREQLLQEDNQIQEKAQNYKNKIIEKQQAKDDKAREKADKDAEDSAKKEADRKVKALNDSVILFQNEKHAADEQLAFYQSYYAKLDKLQGGTERIKNASDFSAKVLEITNKTIADELELQKKGIEQKKRLSSEEQRDLLENAEFLKKTETERVNSSLLTETDKTKALEEIQKGYLESVTTINKTFEESEKTRKEEQAALDAVAFEMRLLTIQEQGIAESEIRRQILTAEYEEKQRLIDADLANEKITAQQATAIRLLEEKKYAQATKVIDKEVAKTKRAAQFQIANDAITVAKNIFGESKALAVASALINTYQGITAELSTKAVTPYEIGLKIANVAVVASSGFAAVKNILKTDKGSSGSGSSGGGATTSTPAAVFENPARTSTVATVDAAPPIDAPQAAPPVLVLETLQEVQSQQQIKIKST